MKGSHGSQNYVASEELLRAANIAMVLLKKNEDIDMLRRQWR